MKKSMLKDGMTVTYRIGWVRTVKGSELFDESGKRVMDLSDYTEDLFRHRGCRDDLDIVKVEWKRSEPVKMSMNEVEDKLGVERGSLIIT